MAVPRNNLKDVLANAPATPSTKSSITPGANATAGKSKFKPATTATSNKFNPGGGAIVHKTTSYTSFSTPGFGKTKPAPPLAPLNAQLASSSYAQHRAANPSTNASAHHISPDTRAPAKRMPPASFSVVDPPSKRPRPSLELDKENHLDTQAVDLTEAEDSGYISFRNKGKAKEIAAYAPSNIGGPSSGHSSAKASSGTRTFSFDFGDLLSLPSDELEAHRLDILDARGHIMDLRSQANRPLAAILGKFDDVLQDRLLCLTTCQKDEQLGQTRHLPHTKWISSPSSPTVSPVQIPQQLQPSRMPPALPVTPPPTDDNMIEDVDEVPIANNFDTTSDDELWEQSGAFDDRDFVPQIYDSFMQDGLSANSTSVAPIETRLASPVEEPDPTLTQAPTYHDVMRTLRDVFKLESFRKNQLEAISAFMAGHNTFVLMPTGGGKSLCFQLPAVCKNVAHDTVTIVVGPLLALMQDQVVALENKGLDVVSFTKDFTGEEASEAHSRLNSFNYANRPKRPCMLYVTPEKLEHSNKLKEDLRRLYDAGRLGGIVVDEAHCITTWGRSFRESYTKLDWMRKEFPNTPVMALTATANKQAVEDIVNKLDIPDCKRFTMSFNRKNLFYEVRARKSDSTTMAEIMEFVRQNYPNGSGIIYLNNKNKCDKWAEELKARRFSVASYHADLSRETKMKLQNEWQSGKIQVIIATIAFGMGIDKPDVRFVIHFGMPNSLSGYYQETGRAGRDGKPSHCRLYYSAKDVIWKIRCAREEASNEDDKEDAVENVLRVYRYCQNNVDCRRVQVLSYFDESFNKADCLGKCDNCLDTSPVTYEDLTASTYKLLEMARNPGDTSITRAKLVNEFVGDGDNHLQRYNKGEKKERAERIFDYLYASGILNQNIVSGDQQWVVTHVQVTRKANEFVKRGDRVELPFRERPKRTRKPRAAPNATPTNVTPNNPAPNRPPAQRRRAARPVEIEDDPIALYVSDEEDGRAAPPVEVERQVARPSDDAYTEGDFVANRNSDEETAIMQECAAALRKKVAELQRSASDDLDALFNEDTIALLSVTLPADVENFRFLMSSENDFDLQTANKYIPALITECVRYKLRIQALKGKQPQSSTKPLSVGQYKYRQATSSRPASGQSRR